MAEKKYEVVAEKGAWIAGRFHAAGEKIAMTEAQAEYLLLAGVIATPAKPAPAAATPAKRKKRG